MSISPGIYRHFKGSDYLVLGQARHSETEEDLVVYRPLRGPSDDWWVRPLTMFQETVEVNGEPVSRFTFIKGVNT